VLPESGDDKLHNSRRRRRSGWAACGLWMQAGENVAGVNVGNAHVVCCSVRMLAAAGPNLGSE